MNHDDTGEIKWKENYQYQIKFYDTNSIVLDTITVGKCKVTRVGMILAVVKWTTGRISMVDIKNDKIGL